MGHFATIHDVPQGLRYVGGYPLTLEQINEIVDAAQASSTGPTDFAVCLGQAKGAFMQAHSVIDSVWV